MRDLKQLSRTAFNSITERLKTGGREARIWLFASVVFLVMVILFLFNLMSFDLDASYSNEEVAEGRKAVEEHDYSDVKTIESMIKTLEAKDEGEIKRLLPQEIPQQRDPRRLDNRRTYSLRIPAGRHRALFDRSIT